MKKTGPVFLILFLFVAVARGEGTTLWATKIVSFSSEYSKTQYSSRQALGRPSLLPNFGRSPCAWAPKPARDSVYEWIRAAFSDTLEVRQIAISLNYNPGSVRRVFLYGPGGNEKEVFFKEPRISSQSGRMLNIFLQEPLMKSGSVKIEVLNAPGFSCQIDAVAISTSESPINVSINIAPETDDYLMPENLESVNSAYSELLPVVSPDGKELYFTRDMHPGNFGFAKKEDIWYAKIDKYGILRPRKLPPPINNMHSNFTFSVTQDGNGLLLGNSYKRDGTMGKGVSISYIEGDSWAFPEALDIKDFSNISMHTGGYFLASSGRELILSINDGQSYGGLDLYVSYKQVDGSWARPVNLGPGINTASDDVSPFFASDGKTLYFSTAGFPGYGDNDMFMSRMGDSWNEWSEPMNLGPAINTGGWDAFFSIAASGEHAYFVSTRNSIGDEDIFRLKLPEPLKPKAVALISGKVINAKTKEPLEAEIIFESLPDGKLIGSAKSNRITGNYKIALPKGKKYGFLATSKGFVSQHENLDLRDMEFYKEIEKDLILAPIEKGQKIRMNNIFFEFGKYELLEDSYAELNRLVKIMKENPSIEIEIAGHTDNIGGKKFNRQLSKNRAAAVAEYLKSKGVPARRLNAEGYGQSSPAVDNDTEENRALNRRVEFKIVK